MKGIYLIFISFLSMAYSSALAQEKPIPITDLKFDEKYANRPNPVINGEILNATEDELKEIAVNFTVVSPNMPSQRKFSTTISKDGRFTFTLPSNLPYQQIWFSLGEYVYSCLYANQELHLIFDLEKLKKQKVYMLGDGIEFSGKDGLINQTLNAYIMYNKKHLPDFYQNFYDLKVEDPRYMGKIDSLFILQKQVDVNFLTENNDIAEEIIASETKNQYISNKIKHLLFKNEDIANMKELLVPVYAITNESGKYLRYLHWYINNIKLQTKEARANSKVQFAKIDSVFPESYADLIKLQVSSQDLSEQLAINENLIPTLKTRWVGKYIAQENTALEDKLAKMHLLLTEKIDTSKNSKIGKYLKNTNFHASMYLNEAETGEDLLRSIRAAFPNKLIVMDLWATWCAPCIDNMPHQKNLQQQVTKENLPVVFVYLCTDGGSSESKWQNKIAELEQPGEHIFVENKQMNELLTLFNGAGYPTYAVIKPNGQIDTKTINLNSKIDIEGLKNLMKE